MGSEVGRHEASETTKPNATRVESSLFDRIDNRMEFALSSAVQTLEKVFNPDERVDILFSTLGQREAAINTSGREVVKFADADHIGNSRCYPNTETAKGIILRDKMAEFGQTNVEYRNGVVDFSPFSKGTVRIDNMTSDLGKNYTQAAEALSMQWNSEGKGGKTDWTPQDVKLWVKANHLAFHECSDMKTCQFVPRVIHESFHHPGGRFECRIREGKGEVPFDGQ